ncbi:MAG: M23 family metallopeptidase [bacterium]|nr:M23 family metallopeptidase [bacterium]
MKITIIPHNTSNIKTFRIRKFWVVVLVVLIVLPIISRCFLPKGFLNSSAIEDMNNHLESSLNVCYEEYGKISAYYKNVLSKVNRIDRFQTVTNISRANEKMIGIDELLGELKDSKYILNKVEQKLTDDGDIGVSIPCILPTNGFVIQTFGKTKYIFTGEERYSQGIDIAVSEGSAIFATGAGRVEYAGFSPNSGLTVRINHNYGFETTYSHLGLLKVSKGQTVKRNQVIGYAGKTGKTVGPRLHYEVWREGRAKNPVDYIVQEIRYF